MTSFEFTWDIPKKPIGSVFARKRKPPINKNQEKEFGLKSNVILDNLESRQDSLKVSRELPNIKQDSNDTHKYIKRKQKKDMVLRKTGTNLEESETSSKPQFSLFSNKHKDIYINANIRGKSVVEKVFSSSKKFGDLNIHKYLVSNLEKHSFHTLTNVQEKAIPLVLEGKNLLIRSQTGSGKTLAYAVPIINFLHNLSSKLQRNDGVQAIIVVPTRELALQTHELFDKINTFQWIVVGHLCGGENRKTEKDRLRKGTHILIATPGRLLDHILHTTAFKLDRTKYLILDEADRLLDMGFKKDIVKIIGELNKSKLNATYDPLILLKNKGKTDEKSDEGSVRQTILLSATLSKDVTELVDFTMKDYDFVDGLDEDDSSNKIKSNFLIIPSTVKQEFILIDVKHKLFMLSAILIANIRKNCKIFVFMATSQMVDYYYGLFNKFLVKMSKNRGKICELEDSDEEEVIFDTELFKLHGSMDQISRKQVFTSFRKSKKGVLLCTDVAARGIDVPAADCIIQYTGPQSDDDYLHRVGRTGRAGNKGNALIFLTHEEQEYVTRLQEHKVFLKEASPNNYLKYLCDLMDEPDKEKAATALQRHFENGVSNDKNLHKMACLAYTSWSRFYNTYPSKMRQIFNFRTVNLGHYATSFALRETPSNISKMIKNQIASSKSTAETKKLNKKLSTHDEEGGSKQPQKRKIHSISLTTSEFSSGLETKKKKRKKN